MSDDREIRIGNHLIEMVFWTNGTGCELRNIVHTPRGATFGIDRPGRAHDASPSPFWEVAFRNRSGELLLIDSLVDGGEFSFKSDETAAGSSATLSWERIPLTFPDGGVQGHADVRLQLRFPPDSPHAHWRVEFDLSTSDATLWRVTFPRFPDLHRVDAAREDDALLLPSGWGTYIQNPTASETLGTGAGQSTNATYPSSTWPMQFLAFDNQDSGLYLGLHDPDGRPKGINVESDTQCDELAISVDHYPENMGRSQPGYKIQYDIVMGVYSGDWYDAAQIYREWALEEATWITDSVVERDDVPRWLTELCLWWTPGFAAAVPWEDDDAAGPDAFEQTVSLLEELQEAFPVPTGVHWYRWHQIPFDTDYPDYFPVRDGFEDAIEAVQASGMHVMPYINARLADPNSRTWQENDLAAAAAKRASARVDPSSRSRYTEVYSTTPQLLSPVCAATDTWQKVITNTVRRLRDEVGVHAVYLDQIAAASPPLCFDPAHGHPLGGGSYGVAAYQDLLESLNADCDAPLGLTSECNAEPFMNGLGAYLMWHAARSDQVPLFPTVYGEYSLTFGREFFESDLADLDVFSSKLAQLYSYGAQLGWFTEPFARKLLDPDYETAAAYLREVASALYAGRTHILPGRRLRDPKPRSPLQTVTVEWDMHHHGTWDVCVDSVLGSVWTSPAEDGIAFAVTNWTDTTDSPVWRFDADHLSFVNADEYAVRELTTDTAVSIEDVGRDEFLLETTLPGRSASVFHVTGRMDR